MKVVNRSAIGEACVMGMTMEMATVMHRILLMVLEGRRPALLIGNLTPKN